MSAAICGRWPNPDVAALIRATLAEDGPNWRLNFNPGAVPAGYTAAWEHLRPELESRYDMAED